MAHAAPSSPAPVASNSVGSASDGVEIRPRLAGVKPNSEAMRIMISAWRLAIDDVGRLDRDSRSAT